MQCLKQRLDELRRQIRAIGPDESFQFRVDADSCEVVPFLQWFEDGPLKSAFEVDLSCRPVAERYREFEVLQVFD